MLVAALLLLAAQAPAADEAPAPPAAEVAAQIGVEPVHVGRRARKRDKKLAAELSEAVTAALTAGRADVVATPLGDAPPVARGDRKRRAGSLARAAEAGLKQVVSSALRGRGRRATLVVELLTVGEDAPAAVVTVKPRGRDRDDWLDQVTGGIAGGFVAPPPPPPEPEPEPEPEPPPEPEPVVEEPPPPPPPPPPPGSPLPWVLGAAGTSTAVAGLAAAGGAVGFLLAQSADAGLADELADSDPRRAALTASAGLKGALGVTLAVVAGVAVLGGGAALGAAFVLE